VAVLCVPELEPPGKEWPTLGPQVVEFLTGTMDGTGDPDRAHAIFGPGSLKGEPYVMDPEKVAATYRVYEVYPRGHPFAGRRRFKRVGISWRKGTAKTEWAAEIVYAELHPDAPVRFNGWNDDGTLKQGKPVRDPYIPMVAYSQDQAEELAFGALLVICSEGPDADLFDVGLERILVVEGGRPAGKAVALSGSPNAADGARTTMQHFDETHRQELPRLVQAHDTMLGNIPKRPLEDPWTLETTTAGRPGAGSIAEGTHKEAQLIAEGKIRDPDLWYFHREAGPQHDLSTLDGRIAAVTEATGPAGEYGPGQFQEIAKQWDRPRADRSYLERVWLNRWTRSDAQAYDVQAFEALGTADRIAPGAFVTVGFDGARFPGCHRLRDHRHCTPASRCPTGCGSDRRTTRIGKSPSTRSTRSVRTSSRSSTCGCCTRTRRTTWRRSRSGRRSTPITSRSGGRTGAGRWATRRRRSRRPSTPGCSPTPATRTTSGTSATPGRSRPTCTTTRARRCGSSAS
jgi:hypothetical protein